MMSLISLNGALPMLLEETGQGILFFYLFIFKIFIYLFMRDTAEGEAGSMQGARCGTRSQDPGTTT